METDIQSLLDEINAPEENNEVVVAEENKLAIVEAHTDDSLIDLTLKKNETLEAQADAAFQLFFDPLARGTDHAAESKIQMLEALKVKVELNKMLVEMAKIKKKSVDPKVGIQINTVSPLQAGIDLAKIKEAM